MLFGCHTLSVVFTSHCLCIAAAYKQADGRKIDNKRVIVDVERGRTVPNWRPRRLGGGLGSTRIGGDEVNQRHSGRQAPNVAARGANFSCILHRIAMESLQGHDVLGFLICVGEHRPVECLC